MKIFSDFLDLFYPRTCAACGFNLFRNENLICTKCLFYLPKTNFHKDVDNPVARLFWGRVKIEYASSYFYFTKGSRFRKLIHKLKYKGQKQIGFELGKHFGFNLAGSPFKEIDIIIPVPLHPKKEKKRGYNQSEWIARGIAEAMNKKVETKWLYRSVATQTQTKKTRFERWENVEDIFHLHDIKAVEGKHILLVDDVVTTGSTLEACAKAILMAGNSKVSIVTLAVA
jgi:ComF family protein